MEIRELKTHAEVVEVFGGKKPFAKLISTREDPRTDNHVGNYLRDKYFPTDTYVVVTSALADIGCSAPLKLFKKMVPPKHPKRPTLMQRAG